MQKSLCRISPDSQIFYFKFKIRYFLLIIVLDANISECLIVVKHKESDVTKNWFSE